MKRKFLHSIRAYLGGLALGLGGIGLFVVLLAIPITYVGLEMVGSGFRSGPARTPAQVAADVRRELGAVVWRKLTPMLVTSLLCIGYGVFEAVKEQQRQHDGAA